MPYYVSPDDIKRATGYALSDTQYRAIQSASFRTNTCGSMHYNTRRSLCKMGLIDAHGTLTDAGKRVSELLEIGNEISWSHAEHARTGVAGDWAYEACPACNGVHYSVWAPSADVVGAQRDADRAAEFERVERPTLTPGTIIHGTMRDADVIPALLDALERVDAPRAYRLFDVYAQCLDELSRGVDAPDAEHLREKLFDTLQHYAPDGHYVGAHWGDGADYGVWPAESEVSF